MDNIGRVEIVRSEICIVRGFKSIGLGNVVAFSSGVRGLVLGFSQADAEVAVFDNSIRVKKGDLVRVIASRMTINIGDELLGRVINPLSVPLDGKGAIEILNSAVYPIEAQARPIHQRAIVNKPFKSGFLAIDSQIPIGLGQRELLLGEKKSGQNDLAIDVICNQTRIGTDMICIYIGIDTEAAAAKRRIQRLEDNGALKNTVAIIGRTSEAASLNYIAPMAGMSIAEWFSAKGNNVLVVFDDLTRHAKVYRQLSLLLERPASREAYPGDIFYLHSRLLERCGAFNESAGNGTITSLPIVETQSEDATDYITTNLMSITDGHILFRRSLANQGHQPPIDSGFSVSRIGGQAQAPLMKKLSEQLKGIVIRYEEIAKFMSFGSDLPQESLETYRLGQYIESAFEQSHDAFYTPPEECALMYFIVSKKIARWSDEQIGGVIGQFIAFIRREPYSRLLDDTILSLPYEQAQISLNECINDFMNHPETVKPIEARERLVAEIETVTSLLQDNEEKLSDKDK